MRVENFPRAEILEDITHRGLLRGPENLTERAIDRLANIIIQRNLNGCTGTKVHINTLIEDDSWGDSIILDNLMALLKKNGYQVTACCVADGIEDANKDGSGGTSIPTMLSITW